MSNELTADRRDALQEMINISFGQSMASLAELLNVFIELSVPDVQLIASRELVSFLRTASQGQETVCLVQQTFRGSFFGEALLVLPADSSRELVTMLAEDSGFSPELEIGTLELEVLLEVGNVVVGACLGKFAELLDTLLSFNPPTVLIERLDSSSFANLAHARGETALSIKTFFQVEERQLTGYLFIFLPEECLSWLFREVDLFLESLT